jgi:putative (di)nucleoside polyphosphate hydrolase
MSKKPRLISNRAKSVRIKKIGRKTTPANFISDSSDLVGLLSAPETRLLMKADNVDEAELRALLEAIALQLKASRPKSKRRAARARLPGVDKSRYRPGVGIVVLNKRGEVLVARRLNARGNTWQMPQGGIGPGEAPLTAAFRELKEEIGLGPEAVQVLAESERWLYYDVPHWLAQSTWAGRWRGQRQKWFVMLFTGQDSDIDLATDQREFERWQWLHLHEVPQRAVSFKRQLYRDLLGEFAPILESQTPA